MQASLRAPKLSSAPHTAPHVPKLRYPRRQACLRVQSSSNRQAERATILSVCALSLLLLTTAPQPALANGLQSMQPTQDVSQGGPISTPKLPDESGRIAAVVEIPQPIVVTIRTAELATKTDVNRNTAISIAVMVLIAIINKVPQR